MSILLFLLRKTIAISYTIRNLKVFTATVTNILLNVMIVLLLIMIIIKTIFLRIY